MTECEKIKQWIDEVYTPWYVAQMNAAMTSGGNSPPPPPPGDDA